MLCKLVRLRADGGARKSCRLHTITASNGGSKGMPGGERIQATMAFEEIIRLHLELYTKTGDCGAVSRFFVIAAGRP